MLDSFYDGIPHSYNVPDHYFRSKDYLPKGLHPDPLNSQESIEDRVSSKFGALTFLVLCTHSAAFPLLKRSYRLLTMVPSEVKIIWAHVGIPPRDHGPQL